MQRRLKEEPKGGRTLYGQGGAAVRTLGCGRSDRWAGMVPRLAESKTLTPVKGAFIYNTNLDTTQPGPW